MIDDIRTASSRPTLDGFFCLDFLGLVEMSLASVMRGVVDIRGSSVFVLQQLFGRCAVRQFSNACTSDFCAGKPPFRKNISSCHLHSNLLTEVRLQLLSSS